METVYLDELFLLNLVIDYFLLLGTAKICALPFRRGRFLAGAALGAVWCCLSLVPRLAWLDRPVMRPVLAAAMTLVAFGPERRLWRCMGAFLGVSALFGGAVFAAGLYQGSRTWQSGGGRIVRLDMRVLVISFALCWGLVSLVFRRTVKNAQRRVLDVTLQRRGKTVRLRALEDTGNGLYDPLTGCAALVAEAEAVQELFSPQEAVHLFGPATEAVKRIPGLRLIPYAGIGGDGHLLAAFRPDKVMVDGQERQDLIAAVAPKPIGTDGSYQAVL
ncbi:MAG: sigma-E processing peptidase SpoIIGA [Oscillospiraceae bacterium]|nr:sigma-E processing peptidase SpoIIGA [Oscillospiraceae bacterium]